MRLMALGFVIAVLGGIALWIGGIPYTDRTEVLELGPIEATAEVRERVEIPPLVGGLVMAIGAGIAVYGASSRR